MMTRIWNIFTSVVRFCQPKIAETLRSAANFIDPPFVFSRPKEKMGVAPPPQPESQPESKKRNTSQKTLEVALYKILGHYVGTETYKDPGQEFLIRTLSETIHASQTTTRTACKHLEDEGVLKSSGTFPVTYSLRDAPKARAIMVKMMDEGILQFVVQSRN